MGITKTVMAKRASRPTLVALNVVRTDGATLNDRRTI
jgi:hypothetical protein